MSPEVSYKIKILTKVTKMNFVSIQIILNAKLFFLSKWTEKPNQITN